MRLEQGAVITRIIDGYKIAETLALGISRTTFCSQPHPHFSEQETFNVSFLAVLKRGSGFELSLAISLKWSLRSL